MLTVGVDLGATKLAMVLTDDDDRIVRHTWVPHSIATVDDLLATLKEAAEALLLNPLLDAGYIAAIGVACAGWVSADQTTLLGSAILGIADVPLVELIQSHYGVPVFLENDGNATLWAEQVHGAAQGAHSPVLFTIGTGVGGAIIANGALIRGANGFGTEFGHMAVPGAAKRPCVCGDTGCLETIAGGRSLQTIATELRSSGASPYLQQLHTATPTARELGLAADSGDAAAIAVLTHAAEGIADAIAALIPVLDPDLIVIGGSVTQGIGAQLLPRITQRLGVIGFLRARRGTPPIVQAALGASAAVIGAADIGRRRVHPVQTTITITY